MKHPRDLSADELVGRLKILGYRVTRQVGSHMRLTTEREGQHHITIPAHKRLTIGKVDAVLWQLVDHFGLSRKQIEALLFE